jgi:nucleoside-diphosphate-sugar epimerase
MKRVLITGGSGFVGANLARRLLRNGYELHLLLRPQHQAWRLAGITGQFSSHLIDIKDREAVARCVREIRPEWVFHLSAYGAYSAQTGIERMISTNLTGTVALLDACAEVGVAAFVHAGSSSEYGYKDHAVREDEVIHPNSQYAITKAAATHYCQLVAAQQGIHACTARLYSIYGPYEEPTRLIPTLIIHGLRGALPPLASPQIGRDFVYVDDAVEAMLRIAMAGRAGEVYNVCTGVQSTLSSVVQAARRLMNIPAEPVWTSMAARSWDTSVWVGSPELAASEIGWRAQVAFCSGMEHTVAWMQENPALRTFYEERILNPDARSAFNKSFRTK